MYAKMLATWIRRHAAEVASGAVGSAALISSLFCGIAEAFAERPLPMVVYAAGMFLLGFLVGQVLEARLRLDVRRIRGLTGGEARAAMHALDNGGSADMGEHIVAVMDSINAGRGVFSSSAPGLLREDDRYMLSMEWLEMLRRNREVLEEAAAKA